MPGALGHPRRREATGWSFLSIGRMPMRFTLISRVPASGAFVNDVAALAASPAEAHFAIVCRTK
jgi:hypothetical protein